MITIEMLLEILDCDKIGKGKFYIQERNYEIIIATTCDIGVVRSVLDCYAFSAHIKVTVKRMSLFRRIFQRRDVSIDYLVNY